MGKIGNIGGITGSDIVCLEGNGCRPSHKGDGWRVGAMYTLNSTEVHCVAYGIGSYYSNAWKSSNPHSGVYEAEVTKTLDHLNCGYPACNQGGTVVVEIHSVGEPSGRLKGEDNGR